MSASDSDSDLHPLPANLNRVGLSPNVSAPTRSLAITTYGHRFGPLNGPQPDLIFNARTLPNPPKHIRASSTGLSKSLQESFFAIDAVRAFFDNAVDAVRTALAAQEHVTVAVYCEMGRHRSVAIAERLACVRWDRDVHVTVHHRDKDRNKKK